MSPDTENAPHKLIAEIHYRPRCPSTKVLSDRRHPVWCVDEQRQVCGMINLFECGVPLNFDCQEEVEELLQWIVLVKCKMKKPSGFIALAMLTPAASLPSILVGSSLDDT